MSERGCQDNSLRTTHNFQFEPPQLQWCLARFPDAELQLIWHISLSPTESLLRDQRGWAAAKLQCLQAAQLNSHTYLLMLLRCLYGKMSLQLLFFIPETWRVGFSWTGRVLWGPLFLVGWVLFGLMPFVCWVFFLEKHLIRICLRPCLHKNDVLVEMMKPPLLTVTPPIQMLLFK